MYFHRISEKQSGHDQHVELPSSQYCDLDLWTQKLIGFYV